MRYLIAAALMLLTPVALAADPLTLAQAGELALTPELIEAILVAVFGSKAAIITTVVTIAAITWPHLRPYVPNPLMAKLPTPLIRFLEWWAGNHRHASNDRTMSAEAIRARSKL